MSTGDVQTYISTPAGIIRPLPTLEPPAIARSDRILTGFGSEPAHFQRETLFAGTPNRAPLSLSYSRHEPKPLSSLAILLFPIFELIDRVSVFSAEFRDRQPALPVLPNNLSPLLLVGWIAAFHDPALARTHAAESIARIHAALTTHSRASIVE